MSLMRSTERLRPCLLPVFGLCFAYWLVFERPLTKNIVELTARHAQLSQTASVGNAAAARTQSELAERIRNESELKEVLKQLQQRGAQLVAQRSDKLPPFERSNSSAAVMTQVSELLQAHELECLDSKIISESPNPSADAPGFLKSIADVIGENKTGKTKAREIRVTLRGRFEDVRSALREMQVALACVYVVSLEMEPEIDGLHIWKLILLV